MKRSTRLALGVGVPILAISFLLVARTGDQPPVHWVVLAGLLAVFVAVTFFTIRDLVRMFRADDPEATAIAARLGKQTEQRYLIARWLRRSRWYRNVGGAAGVVAGLIAGGIGGMFVMGLAGLTIGSLLAELHLVRPERTAGAHRTAGLERRSLTTYWNPRHQLALAAVALGGLLLLTAFAVGRAPLDFRPLWVGAAMATVLLAVGLQWRVATRRRPALPATLRGADNMVRSLAITQGIANPTLSLVIAFIGQSLWRSNPGWSAAAWIVALLLFWGGRRLGLDWLLDQPPLAASSSTGPSSAGPTTPGPSPTAAA